MSRDFECFRLGDCTPLTSLLVEQADTASKVFWLSARP